MPKRSGSRLKRARFPPRHRVEDGSDRKGDSTPSDDEALERRTKQQHGPRFQACNKAAARTPPVRKRRVVALSSGEEEDHPQSSSGSNFDLQQDPSRGYETHLGESDADDDEKNSDSYTYEDDAQHRKRRMKTHTQSEDLRKPVLVDSKGIPYGTMKKVLEQEVKLLAKDLDPRHSWEGQPQHAKDRFFKRVYAEWEIKGKGNGRKNDEMWFQKIVTKVLINLRFRLGRLIDSKATKPPEVSTECWNDLVKWRASEVLKKRSAQMRSISRRRASKASQMQGLREVTLVRLSIRLQREPFETEINEEVEKEYQRLEAERLGEEEGTEKSVADMVARLDELEAKLDASNERLEAKIDASHSRLEGMLQQLLASRAPTPSTPLVSPRDIQRVGVSVVHPIVVDGRTAKAKEKEVVSPELTMQVGEQAALAGQGVEVAGREKDKDVTPTPGVDTATVGVGPSSIVRTSPKLTPQVGGRDSQPVAGTGRTSPRTHLDEMLAQVVINTAATEAGPSSAVALEQPVQVVVETLPDNVGLPPRQRAQPEKTLRAVKAVGLSKPFKADPQKAPGSAKSAGLSKPGKGVAKAGTSTGAEVAKKKFGRVGSANVESPQ